MRHNSKIILFIATQIIFVIIVWWLVSGSHSNDRDLHLRPVKLDSVNSKLPYAIEGDQDTAAPETAADGEKLALYTKAEGQLRIEEDSFITEG